MKTVMMLRTEDPIPTRYSLLSRLQSWDDQESWKDFFDTYWRLIHSVAIKSGLTEAEAQDVVQDTVICVAKDIHKFKRDRALGSFKGWLRNITRWRIADQFEKRTPGAPGNGGRDLPAADRWLDPEQISDPAGADQEAIWQEEWQANLLAAAVERVKQRVKEEHYQIFYLSTVKEWPVSEVARAFKISAAQVYLIKHRISARIKKEVRRLEAEPV
jgi:RNA polymerase sigma factor (sigma-70 family)